MNGTILSRALSARLRPHHERRLKPSSVTFQIADIRMN